VGVAVHGFGEADVEERAGGAFLFFPRTGRKAAVDELVEAADGGESDGAKGVVERDVVAVAVLAIEKGTVRDGDLERFLEAKGLGAKLNAVGIVALGFAAFVFHGEGLPAAVGLAVEFDDVGDAMDAEGVGAELQAASDADAGAGFAAPAIDFLVEDAALGGVLVLLPEAFEVDERALALAEKEVLEGGDGEGVGMGR